MKGIEENPHLEILRNKENVVRIQKPKQGINLKGL
jgi:hypothetical protein